MLPRPARRRTAALLLPLLIGAGIAGCAPEEDSPATVTVTTTEDRPNPSARTTADSSTATGTAPAMRDDRPRGYTGAPTGEPTPLNKTIARCAKSSEGIYERGTTWFTDGTSGWTQYCADNFHDGPPPAYEEPAPAEEGPSDWVQGQYEWADCLDSGKTEEECRAELN